MNRSNLLKNCLVGMAVVLLLALVVASAMAMDISIAGSLDEKSPISETVLPGHRYFIYRIHLKDGVTNVFDLTSEEFDAYLFLLDGDGSVVTSDDNGGEGTNARIVFTPGTRGWYTLMVTTAKPEEKGSYNLEITWARP